MINRFQNLIMNHFFILLNISEWIFWTQFCRNILHIVNLLKRTSFKHEKKNCNIFISTSIIQSIHKLIGKGAKVNSVKGRCFCQRTRKLIQSLIQSEWYSSTAYKHTLNYHMPFFSINILIRVKCYKLEIKSDCIKWYLPWLCCHLYPFRVQWRSLQTKITTSVVALFYLQIRS